MFTIYSPEALYININYALILTNRLNQEFPKFCSWDLLTHACGTKMRLYNMIQQQHSYLLSRIATARMGRIKALSDMSGK